MKYRAEIDGLRALAVVPVILFHAGFEAFGGGYVGVDVFFVISGYLITTILIEDIENQRFSIINFYERRARRILPVLFFIMLLCVPFAWMWMLPSQMEEFSSSLIAVSLFVSNILFWRESDYFAAAAEEKPLLHTWSLAVEEQYYLLFPIFLILAWQFGKKPVFWMIVAMAAISLLLSEWGWRNSELANFYLAPTRAWELFAGSIAAFAVQKYGVQKNNFLASLGLAAILFSIFVYDKNTPFPSVYALVPVLGTVLLILYGDKETYAAKLLSRSIFVGIGLISYSAYLWHQPLFAFSKIIWLDLHGLLAFALVLVTFPLAYLSWRFVETPFRDKSKFGRSHIFAFSLAGILLFSMMGVVGLTSNGFEDRHDWNDHYFLTEGPQDKFNDACVLQYPQFADFSTCRASQANPPTIALIGDSHSYVLYEALAARFSNQTVINIGKWECLPFVNDEHLGQGGCEGYQDEVDAFLDANPQIHTIILAGYWGYLSSGGFAYEGNGYRIHDDVTPADEASFLQNASEFLVRHERPYREILILQSVPDLDFNPVQCDDIGLFRFVRSSCRMSHLEFSERKERIETLISALFRANDNFVYVKTQQHFCDNESCFSMSEEGTLYADGDHISRLGAELIIDEVEMLIVD